MTRWLALVFIALTQVGVSAPPPAPVTINELIAHPDDHYDQHLQLTGILGGSSWGPRVCELPSRAIPIPDYGRPCIDIASANWPFDMNDFSRQGALVTITGYFSFTCPHPEIPDEEGIQRVCVDRGGNGFINVESVSIGGYATCDHDCSPVENPGAHEVDVSDPAAARITEFAKAHISAARSRRVEPIVAITLPSLRSETRFRLSERSTLDRYYSEMANAPAWVVEPGRGFRLFDVDKTDYVARHNELCFCIKGDCTNHWREATSDSDNTMFRCSYVTRENDVWYLLY